MQAQTEVPEPEVIAAPVLRAAACLTTCQIHSVVCAAILHTFEIKSFDLILQQPKEYRQYSIINHNFFDSKVFQFWTQTPTFLENTKLQSLCLDSVSQKVKGLDY